MDNNNMEARLKALEAALSEKNKEIESLKFKLKGEKDKKGEKEKKAEKEKKGESPKTNPKPKKEKEKPNESPKLNAKPKKEKEKPGESPKPNPKPKKEKEKVSDSPKLPLEEDKKDNQSEIEERRKSQQSEFLKNFLIKAPKAEEPSRHSISGKADSSGLWKPFQLQPHQTLAEVVPTYSRNRFNLDEFESTVSSQTLDKSQLYLSELKNNLHKPYSNNKRTRRSTEDLDVKPSSDVVIVENVPKPFFKAIFICFHTDNRPPYYGTWRNKSRNVCARRPFARDGELLNYEVESDEEWEDEDGESIVSSGSDSIKNENDDFEVDDFLVPHGHLSGGEEVDEEDDCPRHVTLLKEEDLLKQRSKKLEKLNPVVLGPFWVGDQKSDLHISKALETYSYVFN